MKIANRQPIQPLGHAKLLTLLHQHIDQNEQLQQENLKLETQQKQLIKLLDLKTAQLQAALKNIKPRIITSLVQTASNDATALHQSQLIQSGMRKDEQTTMMDSRLASQLNDNPHQFKQTNQLQTDQLRAYYCQIVTKLQEENQQLRLSIDKQQKEISESRRQLVLLESIKGAQFKTQGQNYIHNDLPLPDNTHLNESLKLMNAQLSQQVDLLHKIMADKDKKLNQTVKQHQKQCTNIERKWENKLQALRQAHQSQLQVDKNGHQSQSQQFEAQIISLQKLRSTDQIKISELERQIKELQSIETSAQALVAETKRREVELAHKIKELTSTNQNYEKRINSLESSAQAQEETIKLLQDSLQSETQLNATRMKELSKLQIQRDSLSRQNKDLSQMLEKAQTALRQVKADKDEMQAEKSHLQSQVSDLRTSLTKVNLESTSLTQSTTQLINTLKSKLSTAQITQKTLEERIASNELLLEDRAKQLEAYMNKLTRETAQKQKHKTRCLELEAQIQVWENRCYQKDSRNEEETNRLKAKFREEFLRLQDEYSGKHSELKQKGQELLKKLSEAGKVISRQKEQNHQTENKMRGVVSNLENEASQLRNQLELALKENKRFRQQIPNLSEKTQGYLLQLQDNNRLLETQNAELSSQLASIKSERDGTIRMNEALKNQIKKAKDNRTLMKQQIQEQYFDRINALESAASEAERTKKECQRLKDGLIEAKAKQQHYQDSAAKWKTQSNYLEEENYALKEELGEMNRQVKSMQQTVDQMQKKVQKTEELSQQCSDLQRQLLEAQGHLSSLKANQKAGQVSRSTAELVALVQDKNNLELALQRAQNQTKKARHLLDVAKSAKAEEIVALSSEVNQLRSVNEQLKQESKSLLERYNKQKVNSIRELTLKNDQLELLRKNSLQLEKQNAKLNKEIQQMAGINRELQKMLQEAMNRFEFDA